MTARLDHVGLYVWNLPRMTAFYVDTFGLVVTDEGRMTAFPHNLAFLTGEATRHHQLVLVSGRPAEASFSTVMQLSFKVDSLDQLREVTRRAEANGASEMSAVSHGNAWSTYCRDPEGNTVEIYADTPWHVPQPFGKRLDLSKDDREIHSETEALCRATPGFRPRAEWSADLAETISATR